jgi:hypothetical protein
VIKEPQVVVHKADQPDLFRDLLDADILSGEDLTEIDLTPPDADAPPGQRARAFSTEKRIYHIKVSAEMTIGLNGNVAGYVTSRVILVRPGSITAKRL